jgi:hypothetical protein
MREKKRSRKLWSVLLAALLVLPGGVLAQESGKSQAQPQAQGQAKTFSQEQLDQLLAPVALYPDDLLTQLLMASTYPLEVVKANNWVKQNKDLKGDALTKALEKQEWDPSVKSLVNFPQVLQMMSDKLDWTQKLGDAFLAQQKDVLATVQVLRAKALEAGNLKSSKEQKVVVEKDPQVIIIQQASPEVVYVPSYNPTVVYGVWAYPAYPPYPVYAYPYGGAAFTFAAGIAVGAAWGYAWGNCNWHGGDVNVNVNRNTNINNNIDRGKYAQQQGRGGQSGSGKWQHDPSHRQGVSYRDSATAKQYGQGGGRQTPSTSQARGYGDRQGGGAQAGTMDRGGKAPAQAGTADRGGAGGGGRENAFSGGGSGSKDRAASDRGSMSRGGSGGYSGGGGGSRGGGGGGGGRGGGGGGRGGGGGGRR